MTTETRQVRAVFANYRRKVQGLDGQTRVGLAMANRGDVIEVASLADGELDRLELNGALMPAGEEMEPGQVEATLVRAALERALNPLDVVREDFGAPVSVSPPPLGARPTGDLTTGDTGVDPADNPAPLPTGTITLGQGTAEEQAALDRLRAVPEGNSAPLPRTDAPDVEDTAALSEFIRTGGDAGKPLTVPETVALAEGDPDRARYVLEAERTASGQDPRKGVSDGLAKIIDEGNAG
jgi:hypothetical protein